MDRGAWQDTVHGSQRVGHNWTNNTFTFQLKKYSGWLQYAGYRLKLQILEAVPRLKFWLWQFLISILGLFYLDVISSSHLKSRNDNSMWLIKLCYCSMNLWKDIFWETILCQEYTILGIWNMKVKSISHSVVSNSAMPWAVAWQSPLSMEFSGQEYCSAFPFSHSLL